MPNQFTADNPNEYTSEYDDVVSISGDGLALAEDVFSLKMLGWQFRTTSTMMPRRVPFHWWRNAIHKRYLHASQAVLEAGKNEPNSNTVDPVVESLVNQTAKIREKEARTDWRAIFLPNSRHFLFEGAQGLNDYIVFREHDGPRNWRHSRKTCSIADLAKPPTQSQNNSHLDRIFHQQMEVVRQTYDEKKDGILNLTAKFGHLYLIDFSPWRSLHISDFNEAIQYRRSDRNAISTSFVPITTPSQHTVNVLVKAGFTQAKQEESIVVSVDHPLKPRWQKKRLEVYLDKELNFQSMRQADRCFLNIDIRRQNKPDIRLAVKSVDAEFTKENIDYPDLLYAEDHLLTWHDTHGLLLDESIIGKATLVRHKKVTTCKLAADQVISSFEQALEVKLIDTTYYENPQTDGTFNVRNNFMEVYVCIYGRDQLFRLCEEKTFLQRLLKFCDRFQ